MFTYYHQIGGRTVAFTTSDDSKTTWMFSDQISSTSLTRDDAGVNRVQRYTPWGETRTDGGLETDHTYTGQIEDTTTGLRFYNARYMDPVLGRFVSPDTIVPNAGNGQDYNRYSYVANNPLRYSDPSGHDACEGGGGGCGHVRAGDSNGDGYVAGRACTYGCQEDLFFDGDARREKIAAERHFLCSGCAIGAVSSQALEEAAQRLIADLLSGETAVGSVGFCAEVEGTIGMPAAQTQGCLMFETGSGDMYFTYGGGPGWGVGVEAGATGGVLLSSSGSPGTWPDVNTSVCVDASGGGGVGGGVAACFGLTSNNQLDLGSWAIEVLGGAVGGASANVSGQGSVSVNLPDIGQAPSVEDALVALETAIDG